MLLSFFCSIMVHAQKEYDSFLKEGKVWKMEYPPSQPNPDDDVSYFRCVKLQGDTLRKRFPVILGKRMGKFIITAIIMAPKAQMS